MKIYFWKDITVALSTCRPKDHILFVRNLLDDINDMRDKPRIIMVAPPHISIHKIAAFIKEETGIEIITFKDIDVDETEEITSTDLATKVSRYIETYTIIKKGWIMYEFPRNFTEVKIFQKHGLYPTHTIQICSSPKRYSKDDVWFENIKQWPIEKFRAAMIEFKRKVFGLRRALNSTYKEMPVNSQTHKELARACIDHTRIPVYKGAPILPRVVLIGTRGSRRRTIAELLSEKYKMIHVDLEELILQGKQMENETGEQLRALEKRNVPIYSKIVISMLQRRLLEHDCLHYGWVLTSFPRDVDDLKTLDMLDTPPNKVIFLSVENSKAYQRLKNRKVNIYDGELNTVDEIIASGENIKEYFTHPRDYDVNIFPEQDDFAQHVEEMLKYCGDSCNIVDAEGRDNEVFERVARIVLQPLSIAPPRRLIATQDAQTSSHCYDFVLRERSYTTIYPNVVYENENSLSYMNVMPSFSNYTQ